MVTMKYVEVADALYGTDVSNILEIIHLSQQAKYFDQKINSAVIHTGFIFPVSETNQTALLYDLTTERIIRQPHYQEHIMQLNGLLLVKVNANYFNIPIPMFFTEIKDNNEMNKHYSIEVENRSSFKSKVRVNEKNEILYIDNIKIISAKDSTLIKEYPLNRTFEQLVPLES